MDEEDILDSKNSFNLNVKLNKKIFKIRFIPIFLLCIGILILDQIMKYLNNFPELFCGGDIIFHFFQSFINICSQLGVSVAAAIMFYYIIEYVNAKKRKDDLEEIRKYLLYTLYAHMNIVCHIKSFEVINRDKPRLKEFIKMFLIVDLPFFFYAYNKTTNDKLKSELNENFTLVHSQAEIKKYLLYNLSSFEKDIKALKGLKLLSTYKGYRDNIEELCSLYKEFYDGVIIYKSEDKIECIDMLVEDYVTFFNSSIETYCYIEKYIESLENSNILQFMRLHE